MRTPVRSFALAHATLLLTALFGACQDPQAEPDDPAATSTKLQMCEAAQASSQLQMTDLKEKLSKAEAQVQRLVASVNAEENKCRTAEALVKTIADTGLGPQCVSNDPWLPSTALCTLMVKRSDLSTASGDCLIRLDCGTGKVMERLPAQVIFGKEVSMADPLKSFNILLTVVDPAKLSGYVVCNTPLFKL